MMRPSNLWRGRVRHRWAALALALSVAVALTLTACGNAEGPDGQHGGGTALSATPIKSILASADKEGVADWYNSFTDDDIVQIVDAFNKQYPRIKVRTLRLNSQQVPSKVITEQRGGKFNADVISSNAEYLNQLRLAGALTAYDPPDMEAPPTSLGLPAGFRAITYINTTVIAYNPRAVKAQGLRVPASWTDFTQPAWRGNFSVDPESLNWYQSLIAQLGHAKALKLVTAIGNNHPRLVPNHTLAVTQVQAGEPVATATAYSHKVIEEAKKTPGQLAFFNADPLPSDLILTDLAKKMPHPAAAQVFDNWLASQAGQRAIVDLTAKISLRSDADNDGRLWNPAKWSPAYADPLLAAKDYNTPLAEFDKAMHFGE